MSLQKYRADEPGDKQPNGATPWFTHWMGGPTLALLRDCPVEGRPDIAPRTVYVTGEPDTYSSQPAACKYQGCTLRGYITGDETPNGDRQLVFRPYTTQATQSGPDLTTCSVSYRHQINPSPNDVAPNVNIPSAAFSDTKALGKALRRAGVLSKGARLTSFRTEADAQGTYVVCFPIMPGMTTYWHAITLRILPEVTHTLPNFSDMSEADLMSFWHRYSRASRYDAAALLGHSRPGFQKIVSTLANFASNRSTRMGCDERGDLQGADCYQTHATMCIDRLPADLQSFIWNQLGRAPREEIRK